MISILALDMTGPLVNPEKCCLVYNLNKYKPEAKRVWNLYLRNKLTPRELTFELIKLHRGLSEEIFEREIEKMKPYPEAKEFIQKVKQKGYKPVIISAEYYHLVEKIAKELGIEEYYGNVGIFNNRKLIDLEKPIIDDERKAEIAKRIKEKYKARKLIAVGDDRTNVKLFEVADFSIAYNPTCPEVEEVASICVRSNNLLELLRYL